jgi:hypothetical protein
MEPLPREECKERVCRVHSTGGVCRGCWVDLTASTESSKGIKHPRAQEADKTKHNDLGYGVIVNTPQTFGSFIHGNRVIIRGTRTAAFLVGRTGHDEETRKKSTVKAHGVIVPTYTIEWQTGHGFRTCSPRREVKPRSSDLSPALSCRSGYNNRSAVVTYYTCECQLRR